MPAAEKHIGTIYSISSSNAIAFMDDSIVSMERTLGGKVYRIGQIGTFVAIPVGTTNIIGMIARVQLSRLTQSMGSTQTEMSDIVKAKKEMEIQLVGSVVNGKFEKGIASFPPIGSDVFMTDDSDITSLFSTFAQFGFAIGDISGYWENGNISTRTNFLENTLPFLAPRDPANPPLWHRSSKKFKCFPTHM